ncbi:MAG: hypothetical protein N3E51_00620 [Candidatus Micrarchaeota archaeon]|nr:hypothetical protein [Candidatus Micrarchaeota archaeon]
MFLFQEQAQRAQIRIQEQAQRAQIRKVLDLATYIKNQIKDSFNVENIKITVTAQNRDKNGEVISYNRCYSVTVAYDENKVKNKGVLVNKINAAVESYIHMYFKNTGNIKMLSPKETMPETIEKQDAIYVYSYPSSGTAKNFRGETQFTLLYAFYSGERK